MKYDNPKIRDVIDGCVEEIREEPDRALDLKRAGITNDDCPFLFIGARW